MKTIYQTKGAAKEYCDLTIDIYENCPHQCEYCYAKKKSKKKGNDFKFAGARKNILAETRKYLEEHAEIHGKMIFLGFSSDPFPANENIQPTLDMIKLLKEFGCKIMFCTKGTLYNNVVEECIKLSDSVGITISCSDEMATKFEPYAPTPSKRLEMIKYAKQHGIETWISFEPVLEPEFILELLSSETMSYVDTAKLGKLNHMELSDLTGNVSDTIDWKTYVEKAIQTCKENGIKYKVKSALQQYLS